ncbi:MAG: polyprenyl synthetase family protein [Candidatus Gastranaerophilales bacterium]|nr:polyprenyl synthetase family protein [Candidatus Gastranaerophilales bacterium]
MFKEYKILINETLKKYFDEYKQNSSYSSKIWDSMAYTTLLDGKRLRAVMCLEIARLLGGKTSYALPLACSLEMMHAYSLIHDDLPSMDNDDLRRGKPTNHKVYGEAIAILAGDSLISFGSQIIIDKLKDLVEPKKLLDIVNDYNKTAGALGIVAGQVADIEAEGKEIDIENLKYIHKYKTGALFKCSMLMGAKIANATADIVEKIGEYADNFGVLFQVYDDIIDYTLTTDELGKTAGKDKLNKKLTYVSAWGLEKAKNIFYSLIDKNRAILTELNIKSKVFDDIYDMLIKKVEK